ncbi:hypothetical protein ATN88_07395 [Enterovibrio coralii]|uniref:Uncharacterized protein n=2 Tax=Enterovibrio coralii TaxID=294935 RepID=A0A135I4X7_9GAMM|nr:hypothetical protein ATN88_07395 [Enterovibrio coralii]
MTEMLAVMQNNKEKLDECAVLGAVDLKINKDNIPEDVLSIAKANKGKLMTPENRLSLVPAHGIGYKFQFIDLYLTEKPDTWLVLDDREDTAYYFSIYNNEGELQKAQSYYKYDQGVKYYLKDGKYKEYLSESCTFSIGKCTFEEDGKTGVVLTEFVDGVWVSNIPTIVGAGRKYTYSVYGSDGLPIYLKIMYMGQIHTVKKRVTPEDYPD